ncbi:MAG TPA: RNA polymerase sigma-70 factor [Bacteroidales bacterium]|nr:RNA polymerase sigma-70 factor [Bacteroidales bacterium]
MNDMEFETLFREQFSPLCNLAYSVIKDANVAKDTVQQVFLSLWQKRTEISFYSSPKSYLCRAVVNTALNYISKEKKHIKLDECVKEPTTEAKYHEISESKISLEDQVRSAINELPPVCQKVFTLSRFSDLTNKEIASELNISVKAVEKHISKALKTLRITLKPLLKTEVIMLFFISCGFGFSLWKVGFWILTLSL